MINVWLEDNSCSPKWLGVISLDGPITVPAVACNVIKRAFGDLKPLAGHFQRRRSLLDRLLPLGNLITSHESFVILQMKDTSLRNRTKILNRAGLGRQKQKTT